MPIIKSAVKRVKQADKRRARNVQTKRTLRDNTRALEAAIEAKDSKKINELLSSVYSSYDQAVKKNLVHKNKAARKKASYSSMVKGVSSSKPKSVKKQPTETKSSAKKTSKK